jgi:hypothetical protein
MTGSQVHVSSWSFGALIQIRRNKLSGHQIVAMMQATEPGHRDNFTAGFRTFSCLTACRSFFVQSEVSSVIVVIADVFVHQAFQMPFVEYDDMIE